MAYLCLCNTSEVLFYRGNIYFIYYPESIFLGWENVSLVPCLWLRLALSLSLTEIDCGEVSANYILSILRLLDKDYQCFYNYYKYFYLF